MATAQTLAADVKDVIEDQLERNLSPKKLKRYLEFLGPALLVITYAEDALRIVMRWGEQMQYMTMQMRWPRSIAWLILMLSLVTQATGTAGVLARRQVKASCYALLAFTALQPVVYGQLDHPDFMFRTLTLLGGLLLLLRHENDIANAGKRNSGKQALSGLTGMADGPGGEGGAAAGSRLQLIGRVLLMVIFFFQGARHLYTRGLTLFSLVGYLALLGLCALVVVGFKARWSAVILAVSLGISNLWLYPFWMMDNRIRDFYKYYFYNTLSIMGGLLLLALYGPGGLSVDHGTKKSL